MIVVAIDQGNVERRAGKLLGGRKPAEARPDDHHARAGGYANSLRVRHAALGKGRHGYLVPAEGEVEVNGVSLKARDGAAIEDESVVRISALKDSEIILVDAA